MKRVFSGVQPSGNLHLGNYLGAIKQWVQVQEKYHCVFCVVDYHAITVRQDPKILKEKIIEVAKIYLAAGINPKKSIIFQQSHVSQHTELAWILNCVARIADLNKMTQFKEKAKNNQETASVGLYDYPVLMAADILLYQTDAVPVGEDQAQHVELARDLARRFNSQFGPVFKIPELIIKKEAARIMGLDNPTKKMSKSATSAYNYIALTDSPDAAAKKIKKAVTDSGREIKYDPENKPAISNLLTIYSLLTGKGIPALEKEYTGQDYGQFKNNLAEVIKNFLTSFQEKLNSISNQAVADILNRGAEQATAIAQETLKQVKEKIGVK